MRIFDRVAHLVGISHKDGFDDESVDEDEIGEEDAEDECGEIELVCEGDADSEFLQKRESVKLKTRFFLLFAQIVSQKLNRAVSESFGDDEEIDDEIDDKGENGRDEKGSRV